MAKFFLWFFFVVGVLSFIYEDPQPIYNIFNKLNFYNSASVKDFLGFREEDPSITATLRAYQRSIFP